jgi:hypothetical protein
LAGTNKKAINREPADGFELLLVLSNAVTSAGHSERNGSNNLANANDDDLVRADTRCGELRPEASWQLVGVGPGDREHHSQQCKRKAVVAVKGPRNIVKAIDACAAFIHHSDGSAFE